VYIFFTPYQSKIDSYSFALFSKYRTKAKLNKYLPLGRTFLRTGLSRGIKTASIVFVGRARGVEQE
jgi:hypothetical protein